MPFYSGNCREAEILASKCPFILGIAGRQKSWHQSSLCTLNGLSKSGKVTEFVQHQGITVITHTSGRLDNQKEVNDIKVTDDCDINYCCIYKDKSFTYQIGAIDMLECLFCLFRVNVFKEFFVI
ncbi:hypothetical protein SADUNF_Sadunf14G0083400 [Salix dunnii]|uniref:Uncharacterized protein n=1 Tax=Salix dunnii TaxID=1413687 RepID=A0A835MTN5_9ROSI|nr:hypothetical protein SADUNF_Sadunf14G0083400 [Salix dunnii]